MEIWYNFGLAALLYYIFVRTFITAITHHVLQLMLNCDSAIIVCHQSFIEETYTNIKQVITKVLNPYTTRKTIKNYNLGLTKFFYLIFLEWYYVKALISMEQGLLRKAVGQK